MIADKIKEDAKMAIEVLKKNGIKKTVMLTGDKKQVWRCRVTANGLSEKKNSILEINDLCFAYPEEKKRALNHVSLHVEDGEFLVLCGKSGCGKSTLLNLAAGLEQPSSGRISLDDREVTKPGADRTVMFQEHGLFPWLTVQENVEFGMKLAKIPLAQRREKADYYLKIVHFQQSKDYFIL